MQSLPPTSRFTRTSTHHLAEGTLSDPATLLKAVEEEVLLHVAAARTRNSSDALGDYFTVAEDVACRDVDIAAGIPTSIAKIRAARQSLLNDGVDA